MNVFVECNKKYSTRFHILTVRFSLSPNLRSIPYYFTFNSPVSGETFS